MEFWESCFKDKQEMWGWKPANSTLMALELFKKYGITNILIPGFGYGRNAKVFNDNGFKVSGIEISETAISLANKYFGDSVKIYHGSVNSMPFNQEQYDGIFSYGLIHLLNSDERMKLISNCYNQLEPNGYMVFVSISKMDSRYGDGQEISKDTFENPHGVTLFFYDSDSIKSEFGKYGLIGSKIIDESIKMKEFTDVPEQKFWYIICKK